MNKKVFVTGSVLGAVMVMAGIAHATILATNGDVVMAGAADVRLNQTQSDTQIIAFQERGCFALPVAVMTDQGVVPAGTHVESHLLHADPVTAATLQGRVRFADPIIGVISTAAGLDASAVCQSPGVVYPAAGAEPNRGFDAATPLDGYNFLSATELAVRMDVPSFSDQLRVLTACGD